MINLRNQFPVLGSSLLGAVALLAIVIAAVTTAMAQTEGSAPLAEAAAEATSILATEAPAAEAVVEVAAPLAAATEEAATLEVVEEVATEEVAETPAVEAVEEVAVEVTEAAEEPAAEEAAVKEEPKRVESQKVEDADDAEKAPEYTSPIDWQSMANSAAEQFQPISDERLEAARTELATRGMAVERRLNPETTFGQGWLDYIAWSGVQKQFATGEKLDVAAARKTLAQLASGAEGLEQPELQRFADSLERFISVASFARAKDQSKAFAAQATKLAELLSHSRLDDARTSFEVERRLALFADVQEGDSLRSTVRGQFGKANVLVEVSDSMLSRLVSKSVSKCDPVTDCILGTSITGTGCTNGLLTVSTQPSWSKASLCFSLNGTINSDTRGVNGPVAIYSAGTTTFQVSKQVLIGDDSFQTLPAVASASTSTRTKNISKIGGGFGARFITMIAKKKVDEKRGQSNAIAADHAEDRLEDSLNEELDDKISEARRDYDDKFTKPMSRRRSSPSWVNYSTTGNSLQIQALQASAKQLGASGSAPGAIGGKSLSARLHQSAINNLLAASLSGATLKKDSADADAVLVGRTKPEWMSRDADAEPKKDFRPWAIHFREGRPVSCVITAEGIQLTIHAKQFDVGDDSYKNWDLTAKFAPVLENGKWMLKRTGPVDFLPTSFDPTAGKGLPSRQLALRANMNKAVNQPEDRLPLEIDISKIDLTDGDSNIDWLMLEAVELSNGWISAGWRAL